MAEGLAEELEEVAEDVEVETGDDSPIGLLLDFIEMDNIAEEIDPDTLGLLAEQVAQDFKRDSDSMSEWAGLVEKGQDLARQDIEPKSEPWQGASNFKSPAILEASIAFGDRATTELLRARNLVKGDIIGQDRQGQKRARVDRVTEYSNWQINHDMPLWRRDQERLFYELSATGTVFKKVIRDSLTGKMKSELIQYPNFVVNQSTAILEEATFTHVIARSMNEVMERVRADLWLDVDLFGEKAEADEGSNAEQDVTQAFDNDQQFLEQNCFYDLDGDGYAEPYCVTIHLQRRKVVRIVARFNEQGIFVEGEDGTRPLDQDEDPTGLELVRIEPLVELVKYGFVHNPNGDYLDIGYYHILSSLVRQVNSGTNALVNSGNLENLQGGFLAKGYRRKMGSFMFKPGEWRETDIDAQNLNAGIVPHKYGQPSQVLLALVDGGNKAIDELTVGVDLQGLVAPNAPATTTLALIQEAMMPASARLQSIVNSMSEEFKILHRLNAEHTDQGQYQRVLDDQNANFEVDFSADDQDMVPTANPEMSSRMQRMHQANAVVSQLLPILMQNPKADLRPVIDTFLQSIGLEDLVATIFPTDEEMDEQQKQRLQQQQAQAQKQEQLQMLQIQQAERDLVVREDVAEAKIIRDNAAALKDLTEMERIKSDAILKREQAETEQQKNQIDMYTAEIDQIDRSTKLIKSQIKERLSDQDRQISRAAGAGGTSAGANAGAGPRLA